MANQAKNKGYQGGSVATAEEIIATLERRPAHLDVILTGPAMPPALMDMADQVTELRRGY